MNRAAGGMGNMQPSPQSMQPGASSSGMGLMPQQQQSHMGGGSGNNSFGQNQGQGQQGNPMSSLSPVQHQGSNPNMQGLFSQGMGGMGMGNAGGGGGGMGGMGTMDPRMAMGNMSSQQQQRQLLLMQQQQRAANGMGGGGGAGQFNVPTGSMNPMMMNQQQQQQQQQLAFQRQQQQQQQQGQGQGPMNSSSPTHTSSPMVPDFSGPSGGPPMRSSSAIPGIARRTRSPSDGAPSPLMPRGMPTRVGSIGQEEYQRMMLQQQHGQAVRAMSSQSPTFNQHQQMMAGGGGGGSGSSNWSQQGGGPNYGMSSADNASGFGTGGGLGIPSPTNNGQSWNTAAQGGYPFAPSPASDHVRNMSATPVPQQQNQGTTQDSPSADQNLTSEFDLFNWNA